MYLRLDTFFHVIAALSTLQSIEISIDPYWVWRHLFRWPVLSDQRQCSSAGDWASRGVLGKEMGANRPPMFPDAIIGDER